MEVHRQITTLRLHAGHPADLGHAPRVRVSAFFVQLERQDLIALAVPPYLKQHLISKYKLKNNGPPVKMWLYMGKRCTVKVQLQWRAEHVGFIKGWSEFAGRLALHIDNAIVYTPMDDDFKVDVFKKETSAAGGIVMVLMLILVVKVMVLDPISAAVCSSPSIVVLASIRGC
jgi:hypothetical protein